MSDPSLARYIADWPRAGDLGVVAEVDVPVRAAWWRFFPADEPGYGFGDGVTPEVCVGVDVCFRGQGIGKLLLLEVLVDCAGWQRIPALSLSVEPDNYAVRLYERLGFDVVADDSGSLTMMLPVTPE